MRWELGGLIGGSGTGSSQGHRGASSSVTIITRSNDGRILAVSCGRAPEPQGTWAMKADCGMDPGLGKAVGKRGYERSVAIDKTWSGALLSALYRDQKRANPVGRNERQQTGSRAEALVYGRQSFLHLLRNLPLPGFHFYFSLTCSVKPVSLSMVQPQSASRRWLPSLTAVGDTFDGFCRAGVFPSCFCKIGAHPSTLHSHPALPAVTFVVSSTAAHLGLTLGSLLLYSLLSLLSVVQSQAGGILCLFP